MPMPAARCVAYTMPRLGLHAPPSSYIAALLATETDPPTERLSVTLLALAVGLHDHLRARTHDLGDGRGGHGREPHAGQ